MFKHIMEMLYNKGLAADGMLEKRAKITFLFLEIACSYIPQTARADAMAEISSTLNDQMIDWGME
jgi:hypothetical protein